LNRLLATPHTERSLTLFMILGSSLAILVTSKLPNPESRIGYQACPTLLTSYVASLLDQRTQPLGQELLPVRACKHPTSRWSPRGRSEAHPFGVTMNRHEVHDLIHRRTQGPQQAKTIWARPSARLVLVPLILSRLDQDRPRQAAKILIRSCLFRRLLDDRAPCPGAVPKL
jgi:hypothetical protein